MQARKKVLVGALGLATMGGLFCSRIHPVGPAGGAKVAVASPAPANISGPRKVEASPPHFVDSLDASVFQKGNIHTHTTWSDGDRPPEDVYAWYRDHGYAFVAVTDHNKRTDPALFRALELPGVFTIIAGEEVTMTGAHRQVHVNALCHQRTIGGRRFPTQDEALVWAVRKITEQGGVALVNHPNFDWSLTARDLPFARGASLLEIHSGHPAVHGEGDANHPSHEQMWDLALSRGEVLGGVAVDDSHHFGRHGRGAAKPGKAWVEVIADAPDRRKICAALAKGRLYASSGVSLRRITIKGATYSLEIATPGVEVEFIGQGGEHLARVFPGDDGKAVYELHGGEGYVRARISTPDGKRAWTQPARLAMTELGVPASR